MTEQEYMAVKRHIMAVRDAMIIEYKLARPAAKQATCNSQCASCYYKADCAVSER